MRTWQRLRLAIPAVVAAACVSGCGQQTKPTAGLELAPLTTEQSQALAIMRFNNYSERNIDVDIEADAGPLTFSAHTVLDLRSGVGYGEYETASAAGDPVESGLIVWSHQAVSTAAGGRVDDVPGPSGWTQRATTRSSPIDVTLLLALNLGADRPENPALLQQSDARLLRTEQSGDEAVWVIRGPSTGGADTDDDRAPERSESRTTYWIDRTGHLQRFEAQVGDAGRPPSSVVVTEAGDLPTTVPRQLRTFVGVK